MTLISHLTSKYSISQYQNSHFVRPNHPSPSPHTRPLCLLHLPCLAFALSSHTILQPYDPIRLALALTLTPSQSPSAILPGDWSCAPSTSQPLFSPTACFGPFGLLWPAFRPAFWPGLLSYHRLFIDTQNLYILPQPSALFG